MKKIVILTFLGLTLIACQNNNSKNDQNARIQELEAKIEQLTETNEKNTEKETVELKEVKPIDDAKKRQIEKLKTKYKHLRAKFVSADGGADVFSYAFQGEKEEWYSFSIVKDKSYALLIDDESSNWGSRINPKFKNKYFDIFYQVEKYDLLGWGQEEDCDVVIKMILVE